MFICKKVIIIYNQNQNERYVRALINQMYIYIIFKDFHFRVIEYILDGLKIRDQNKKPHKTIIIFTKMLDNFKMWSILYMLLYLIFLIIC